MLLLISYIFKNSSRLWYSYVHLKPLFVMWKQTCHLILSVPCSPSFPSPPRMLDLGETLTSHPSHLLPLQQRRKMRPREVRGHAWGHTVDVGLSPPSTPGPSPWLGIFSFLWPPPALSKLSPSLVTVSLKCLLFSFLPISSCLIQSLHSSQWERLTERFIFGASIIQDYFSLITTVSLSLLCCEDANSSLLPVAANVITSLHASSLRTSLHCVLSFIPFFPRTPKAQSLLWVCSVNQPCFLYGFSMSCSPAPKRFPCLSKDSPNPDPTTFSLFSLLLQW